MSTLSFEIRLSKESNDHQVRILVDGQDFLGDEYLGLDPVDFFAQFTTPEKYVLIGRCKCGVIGCGGYPVEVRRSAFVEWLRRDVVVARFDADQYDRVLLTTSIDHSWETQQRRIERLVATELKGTVTPDGYDFEWASMRFKPGALTLHFVKDKGQPSYAYKLVDISWDGRTDESAVKAARQYLKEYSS